MFIIVIENTTKGAPLGRSFLDFTENYSSSLFLLLAIA